MTYSYWHLEHNSYDPSFLLAYNNGTPVAAGDQVAKVVRWLCDYHHMHYDLSRDPNYLDPLDEITPNPDPDPPQIENIFFARDNSDPWVPLRPVGPKGCAVVSGAVDIVIQAHDRDDAGSALVGSRTVWVRNVRWRVYPDSTPPGPWHGTHVFSSMPMAWGTKGNAGSAAQFSSRFPWVSDSDYCAET